MEFHNKKKILKIGLLLDSYELPLWEYTLIKRLINSHYAKIDLIIINENSKSRLNLKNYKLKFKFLFFHLYNVFDKIFFKVDNDAFEKINTYDLLQNITSLKVDPIRKSYSDNIKQIDIDKIKSYGLDVLIRFGFRILRGDILEVAKYGVWSYHHGDTAINRGAPSCFWEVFENIDVTGSTLQIISDDLDAGKVLIKSFSSTNKVSVHRNRNNTYWKSLSFLPRKLEELYNLGGEDFLKKIEIVNKYPVFYSNKLNTVNNLTNWKMFKLLSRLSIRLIIRRLTRLIYKDKWTILYAFGQGLSLSFWKFTAIKPPKDRFFADPFIIKELDKYYIFIEEFINKDNKGRISLIQMDHKGKFDKPVSIIDQPYHLSFPAVFKYRNDYFLTPESRQNKTIELYKCIDFPYKWELFATLMKNVEAVDTIIFYHENTWWMFTNIVENKGASSLDELFLFYSEDLFSNNWQPHLQNPIISDVRKSRSAGNIFIHNGLIIRPSQDNSKRYGHRISFNEIKILNKDYYEEIDVGFITPDWKKNIIATHTFNNQGNLTIIDGIIRKIL